jgi:lipid-binding SYLF domain-containing protein
MSSNPRRKEYAMNTKNRLTWVETAILLTVAVVILFSVPASADDRQEAIQLVEKARIALESFMTDSKMGAFRDLMERAEGVFISPHVLKRRLHRWRIRG